MILTLLVEKNGYQLEFCFETVKFGQMGAKLHMQFWSQKVDFSPKYYDIRRRISTKNTNDIRLFVDLFFCSHLK